MASPDFFTGARYALRGVQLVNTPGIRRFVFVPLLINIAVFATVGWFAYSWVMNWLDSFVILGWAEHIPMLSTVLWLIRAIVGVGVLWALMFVMALLCNLVGAPFNGLLAERVEAHLTGVAVPHTPMSGLIKALPRVMGSELRKLVYLVLMLIGILILHFIPLVNLIAPLVLMAFGAWMYALEYWDAPMGNHGALFGEVRRFARNHRPSAFGFGATVAVASSIPIVNFVVMPIAVAGATALWVEQLNDAYQHD